MSAIFQRGITAQMSTICHKVQSVTAVISCALSSPTEIALNDCRRNGSSQLSPANHRHFSKYVPFQPFYTFASRENSCESSVLKRKFQTVGLYHNVADETLHSIQDAVEAYLEDHYDSGVTAKDKDEEDIPEVNYASGVLTMYLPPHGTYVINKQTPNQQLWWSSPISGPRRYEYDEKRERWVNSRVIDEVARGIGSGASYGENDTLGGAINKEFEELFGEGLGLEA
jgi:frataxin